uniref:Uncharacterized protein n=1 Tax=Parascaris equorum TaxID=6256 RepID=A0A914RZW3_PAREQ
MKVLGVRVRCLPTDDLIISLLMDNEVYVEDLSADIVKGDIASLIICRQMMGISLALLFMFNDRFRGNDSGRY